MFAVPVSLTVLNFSTVVRCSTVMRFSTVSRSLTILRSSTEPRSYTVPRSSTLLGCFTEVGSLPVPIFSTIQTINYIQKSIMTIMMYDFVKVWARDVCLLYILYLRVVGSTCLHPNIIFCYTALNTCSSIQIIFKGFVNDFKCQKIS